MTTAFVCASAVLFIAFVSMPAVYRCVSGNFAYRLACDFCVSFYSRFGGCKLLFSRRSSFECTYFDRKVGDADEARESLSLSFLLLTGRVVGLSFVLWLVVSPHQLFLSRTSLYIENILSVVFLQSIFIVSIVPRSPSLYISPLSLVCSWGSWGASVDNLSFHTGAARGKLMRVGSLLA